MFYNILLISAIHQHESVIGIHTSPPSWSSLPFPTPSHPTGLSQSHGQSFSLIDILYFSNFFVSLSFICFVYNLKNTTISNAHVYSSKYIYTAIFILLETDFCYKILKNNWILIGSYQLFCFVLFCFVFRLWTIIELLLILSGF